MDRGALTDAEDAPEVAATIVDVLARNGVDELFVMPGDAFPILEAVAHHDADGRPTPRIITCLHEAVALAAAHGHFLVSGRPQACLFHVDVGVQMAGGMVHNAQRGRAGVVILSGRTPMTFDGSMPGGRVIDVHWMQDRNDQASVTRDYVKWHADLYRPEPVPHVLQRAFQVAGTEPTGPVSVTLLREMLLEHAELALLDPDRHAPPRPPVPDHADLEAVADLVAGAQSPVAIVSYVGRSDDGFAALQAFAEETAVPVVTRGARANLSTDSPMHAGIESGELLAAADLVLLLDVDVPYIPLFGPPAPGAKVVQIDVDALKADIPVWGFPVDLALQGSTARALPKLTRLVAERRSTEQAQAARERHARLSAAKAERLERLGAAADAAAQTSPMGVAHVARCVANLVEDATIVIDDSNTALSVTAQYVPTRVPGSYFQPMGTSMGWGMGAALGAKLAAPERTVILLYAEGNFFSGVPEPALWAAARHGAPFLTVVLDNAQYAAIKLGMGFEYGDSSKALAPGGVLDLDDAPDISAIAEACGAWAERVDEPAGVDAALGRGLEAVKAGRCAVLTVGVAPPEPPG